MKEEEARTVGSREERAARRRMLWVMYWSLELASRSWRTYLGLLITLALRDWVWPYQVNKIKHFRALLSKPSQSRNPGSPGRL